MAAIEFALAIPTTQPTQAIPQLTHHNNNKQHKHTHVKYWNPRPFAKSDLTLNNPNNTHPYSKQRLFVASFNNVSCEHYVTHIPLNSPPTRLS